MRPVRATALAALLLASCRENPPAEHVIPGADAGRGAAVIAGIGCGACHLIPGIRGARGMVGPPLTGFGRRSYIAGRVPNAPANLVAWLIDPQDIDPETAMPALGLDRAQAGDVAAYLYTLR